VTHDSATLFGLSDRGVVAVDRKADLNVIDTGARPGRLVRGVR
jgi:N-acyl-D-aspartate/D-glutamate deacylase